MKCPKCNSENVSVQITNEVKLKNKGHNILYYIFVWWWWVWIKWLIFTLPALLLSLFGHKKQKVVNKEVKNCVCQNCGYSWKI